MTRLNKKVEKLKEILSEMRSLAIAFSGGADSTLLLKVYRDTLPTENFLAVVASSPIFPKSKTRWAKALAKELGARFTVIETDEMQNKRFRRNLADHCYICKRGLFSKLKNLARKNRFAWVADGTNFDDIQEERYSFRALEELRVRHPLAEAELTKAEVRELSRELSLPTWNRLPQPCLASRLSLGIEITAERMETVAKAETWLRKQGFERPIVRYHQEGLARLKLTSQDVARCLDPAMRKKINDKFRQFGFSLVTLALEETKI